MLNPALSSARLKIDRAKEHFNYLGSAINTRSAEKAGEPISTEFEPHGRIFKLPQESGDHLLHWSLIAGDAFHNLRCALDHLVLQLALVNGTSLTTASKSTFFPVCMSGREFRNTARLLKPHLSPIALTDIKTLQPYYTADPIKPAERNVLYIISKLDNIDKHRMLLVVEEGYSITDVTIRRKDKSIIKPDIRANVWAPMKDTAELGSVDFSRIEPERDEEVDMDVYASVEVFLNEPELGIGVPVRLRILIRQCINRVEAVVNIFGKKFFSE